MKNEATVLAEQVGGDHYRTKPIQPLQFLMANGWDACSSKVLKYVSRHQEKGGLEDIEKALHIVGVRQHLTRKTDANRLGFTVYLGRIVAFLGHRPLPQDDPRISMEAYISMNRIEGPEAAALSALDEWVRTDKPRETHVLWVRNALKEIALVRYGKEL